MVSLTRAGGRVRAAAALRKGVRQGGADDQHRGHADTPAQKDGEGDARRASNRRTEENDPKHLSAPNAPAHDVLVPASGVKGELLNRYHLP